MYLWPRGVVAADFLFCDLDVSSYLLGLAVCDKAVDLYLALSCRQCIHHPFLSLLVAGRGECL